MDVLLPRPITSPIRPLLKFVPSTLLNVADEREHELLAALQGVSLLVLQSNCWHLRVDLQQRQIRITTRVAETLWCSAYAYHVFYDRIYRHGGSGEGLIDLTVDTEIREAMALLKWNFESWLNRDGSPWPDLLPRPAVDSAKGSDSFTADVLCLTGLGFLLHHELAHLRLNHLGSRRSIELEREADASALQWLLGKTDPQSSRFTQRLLGVLVAQITACAYGIHAGGFASSTHPRSFDRLYNSLLAFPLADDHEAWVFTASALSLHIQHSSFDVEPPSDGGHKDLVEWCIDHLAG